MKWQHELPVGLCCFLHPRDSWGGGTWVCVHTVDIVLLFLIHFGSVSMSKPPPKSCCRIYKHQPIPWWQLCGWWSGNSGSDWHLLLSGLLKYAFSPDTVWRHLGQWSRCSTWRLLCYISGFKLVMSLRPLAWSHVLLLSSKWCAFIPEHCFCLIITVYAAKGEIL